MKKIAPAAKAVTAGVVAFCGTLATALADGHVTGPEWCGVIAATALAAGAVFGVPNANPEE